MQTVSTPAVDIVYDCVGYMKDRPEPPVIEQALSMVRDSTGRVVEIGICEATVPLDFISMVVKQVTMIGSVGFSREDLAQALDMIWTKKVDRQGLISHEFPLDQAKEAFETARNAQESVKVLLKP